MCEIRRGSVRGEHSGVFGVHKHRLEVRDKTENSRIGFVYKQNPFLIIQASREQCGIRGPGTAVSAGRSGGPGFVGTPIKIQ